MSQHIGFRFINTNSSVTQKVGVGLSSIVGPSGPQGWQGTIGYQGSQGISGFSTNTGAQGWQGPQGQVGPQGIIGQGFRIFATVSTFNDLCSTNPTGSNVGEFVLITGGELYVYAGTGFGTTGPSGCESDWTYAGDISNESLIIGPTGAMGQQGPQGDIGYQGWQGDIGYQGSQGDIGYQGSQGDIGYQGPQGDIGYQGPQGDIGYTGLQGPQGWQGDIGPQGLIGPTGTVNFESGAFQYLYVNNLETQIFTGTNIFVNTIESNSNTLNIATNNDITSTLNIGTSNSVQTINLGTVGSGQTTINIGGAGDQVRIAGDLVYLNSSVDVITNPYIILNNGSTTINNSGLVIAQTGSSSTGVGGSTGAYFLVNSISDGWVSKAGNGATVNLNQDIGTGASPVFSNIYAKNNVYIDGNVYCTGGNGYFKEVFVSTGSLYIGDVKLHAPDNQTIQIDGNMNVGTGHFNSLDVNGQVYLQSGSSITSQYDTLFVAGHMNISNLFTFNAITSDFAVSKYTGGNIVNSITMNGLSGNIYATGSSGSTIFSTKATISDKLGVGIQNASTKLQVNGAVGITNTAYLPDQTNYNLYMAGGHGTPILGKIYVGDGSGWKLNFASRSGGVDNDLYSFTDIGNLGIGTTGPSHKLDIQGGALRVATGARYLINLGNTGAVDNFRSAFISGDGTNMTFSNGQSGSMIFHTNNLEKARFTNTNQYLFGTVTPISTGSLTGTMVIAKQTIEQPLQHSYYMGLGSVEYNSTGSTYRLIGMGYRNQTVDIFWPSYMGYLTNTDTGRTNGHIVFGTRNVTTDSQPVERMRITHEGCILLNTITPTMVNGQTGTLTVGNYFGTSATYGAVVSLRGTHPLLTFTDYPTAANINRPCIIMNRAGSVYGAIGVYDGAGADAGIWLGDYNIHGSTGGTGTVGVMIRSGGNVGIGTNSPNYPLELNGDFAVQNRATIRAKNSTGTYEVFLHPRWSDDATYLNYGQGGMYVRNYNGSLTYMYLSNSGSVGIGLTDMTSPLHVYGGSQIGTKDVIQLTSYTTAFGVNQSYCSLLFSTRNAGNSAIYNLARIKATDNIIAGVTSGYGDLVFDTFNNFTMIERMRITSQGNVGIGTTGPTQKLHIQDGGLNLQGDNAKIYIGNGSSNFGNQGIDINTRWTGGEYPPFRVQTAFNNAFVITPGGNIGIGTSGPNAALQFGNVTSNRRIVLWEVYNNDHQFYGIGLNAYMLRYQVPETVGCHAFFAATSSTTSNELMRIKGDGTVGINTTSPNANLQVNTNAVTGTALTLGFNTNPGVRGGNYFLGPRLNFSAADFYGSSYVAAAICGGNQTIGGRTTTGLLQFLVSKGDTAPEPTAAMVIANDGKVGIGLTSPAYLLQLSDNSAGKPTSDLWTITSDKRVKQNIVDADIDICYNNILNIPLRRYNYNTSIKEYSEDKIGDTNVVGFVADEFKEYFPKAVTETLKELTVPKDFYFEDMTGITISPSEDPDYKVLTVPDFKGLNTSQIIPTLVGAVKKQHKIIQEKEDKIQKLEELVNRLISLNGLKV